MSRAFYSWTMIMVRSAQALLAGLSYEQIYSAVKFELEIFQTAALLEVKMESF